MNMSNVPKLRFEEFGGEWEENKLENFCNKIASGKSKQNNDGQYDLYGSTGIIGKTDQYSNDGKYILIARVGANAGLTNIVEGKFGVTDNTLIVDLNNKAEVDFVLPLLHKYNLNKLIFGSGQPLITGGQLKELKLFFPSIDEQQKIAYFLSAVDTKIDQLNRKKELLERYKKGVMQKIFSQELRFKADDGSEFSEWEEKTLGDVAEINPKTGMLPDEFIYIDLESVNSGVLLKETRISKHEAPSRAQRVLKQKDILFQMVRPYQRNNLFFNKDGNYVASTGYAQIRANENALFVYHLLHLDSFVNEVMNFCTGTSYPAINSTDLSMISVPLPCEDEQQKIANFLTSIDIKIDLVTQQLDEAKNLKKGLLQQMFV